MPEKAPRRKPSAPTENPPRVPVIEDSLDSNDFKQRAKEMISHLKQAIKGADSVRIDEIRSKIAELEKQPASGALKKDVEPEILALEDELRTLEKKLKPQKKAKPGKKAAAAAPEPEIAPAAASAEAVAQAPEPASESVAPETAPAAEEAPPELTPSFGSVPIAASLEAEAPKQEAAPESKEAPLELTPDMIVPSAGAETPQELKRSLAQAVGSLDSVMQAERAKKMGAYLEGRTSDSKLKERAEKVGLKLLELGKSYNKLPFRTKLTIGLGCIAASAALAFTGGSSSALYIPLSAAILAKRGIGMVGAAATVEAILEKRGMSTRKRYIYAGIAAGVFGGSMIAAEWLSGHEPTSIPMEPSDASGAPGVEFTPPSSDIPNAMTESVMPTDVPAVEGYPAETIGHLKVLKGDGADQAFLNLKQELRAAGYSAEHGPKEIREIMSTRAHALSEKYGFLPGGAHEKLFDGDQLQVNEQGKIVFTHNGKPEILEASGHAHAAETHALTAEQEQTRQLNIEHRYGERGTVPVDPSGTEDDIVSSTPEAAEGSGVQHAAPESHPPTIESGSPTANAITHSPLWESSKGASPWNFINAPTLPAPGTPAFEMRSNIFSLLKETGLGPRMDESFAQYLERANEAILSGKVQPTGVFEAKGNFVARGGDLIARQTLALEYTLTHPGKVAIVELANGYGAPEFAQSVTGGPLLAPDGSLPMKQVILESVLKPEDFTKRAL